MGRRDDSPALIGQGVDWNKLTEVLGSGFPTIPLLPGADKDLPARFGFAKRLPIHLGNVAYPVLRDGKQAEAGPVPPLRPAGAARGLRKDHDVLGHGSGEPQLDAQPPVNVAEAQRLSRVGAKGHRRGRPEQQWKANARPGAVNPDEMLLASQRAALGQAWAAADFCRRKVPGLLLLLRQESTKGLREGAESPARASGGRIAHVFGNDIRALALPVPDHEEDDVVRAATLGHIKRCHTVTTLCSLRGPTCCPAPAGPLARPFMFDNSTRLSLRASHTAPRQGG
jgi:hypothetical protein